MTDGKKKNCKLTVERLCYLISMPGFEALADAMIEARKQENE